MSRLLVALGGLLGCLNGLLQGWRQRTPLLLLLGPRLWLLLGLLAGGVVLLLGILAGCARRAGPASASRGPGANAPRRRAAARGAELRLAFALATAFAAGCLALLQPFWRLSFDLALGLAAAALGGLLLVLPRLARRLPDRLVRRADFFVFALCLLLWSGELGLRGVAWLAPSPLLARDDDDGRAKLAALAGTPGALRFGFPYDARGFYDEEPAARPGAPFVAVIGDSFSVGVVPHGLLFTTVAERALGGAVLDNVGLPSIGPHEYLVLLREQVLPRRPDVVVLCLFVGNDVTDSHVGLPENRWLRRWFSRENLLLYQVPRRLFLWWEEQNLQEGPRRAVGEVPGSAARDHPLSADQLAEAYPWLVDPAAEAPTFSAQAWLEHEAAIASWICGPDRGQFAALLELLEQARNLAAEVPLVVLLHPDELQVEDDLWEAVRHRLGEQPLEREQPQRILGEWLRERGVPCLDLLPALRAAEREQGGRRHVYHLRDSHYNAKGNRIAGEELARFLAR